VAAAFVISDLLGELQWDPQFDHPQTNKSLQNLFKEIVTVTTTL
jgi:hypothetical protein